MTRHLTIAKSLSFWALAALACSPTTEEPQQPSGPCKLGPLQGAVAEIASRETSATVRRGIAARSVQDSCGKALPAWLDTWLASEVAVAAPDYSPSRADFGDGPTDEDFAARQRLMADVCQRPVKEINQVYERVANMKGEDAQRAIYRVCQPLLSELTTETDFVRASGPDTAWVLYGWLKKQGVSSKLARPIASELM